MLQPGTEELRLARETSRDEKARQTFALMQAGFELKRAQLRTRHPAAGPEEIERLFRAWLEEDR
jgi:hypothetical protein